VKILFVILLAGHGLVHAAGFAKAFGLAALPELTQPVSRAAGVAWLAAGLGFIGAAALLLAGSRRWWWPALPAVALSQALIVHAFHDAKLGTIANAIIVVPLLIALADLRPSSLRSRYEAEVRDAEAAAASLPTQPVTEQDLQAVPEPVRAYLRRAGVVGKPRPALLHARFRARMRTAADAGWMSADVDQVSLLGRAPRRLFYMEAARGGVPFHVFHRYVGDAATMQVRVAGLIPVVDASGWKMTQGETVTLLNDLCLIAPAALLDAPVTWQVLGPREVRATYTNAGHTISAVLSFDAAGDLAGFVSEDRYQSDGKTYHLYPWSTPTGGFRAFDGGAVRLPAEGEARWREPAGEWTYGQFSLLRLDYGQRKEGRGP
jgi:hypothetical protein